MTKKVSQKVKIGIIAAVVVVAGYFGLEALKGPSEVEAPEVIRPVRTMKIVEENNLAEGSFQGVVDAAQKVNVSFRVSGPLIERPVNKGYDIKKGDIIARIDPRDFKTQLLSAQAQLAQMRGKLTELMAGARPEDLASLKAALRSSQARFDEAFANYNRYKGLLVENAISKAEFDSYKTGLEVARADLDARKQELTKGEIGARKEEIVQQKALIAAQEAVVQAALSALSDTELRSPFTGIVADLFVENYQYVQAMQDIAGIQDLSSIKLVAQIPDYVLSNYRSDAHTDAARNVSFSATLDALPGKRFPITFREASTQPDPNTQTYALTFIMPYPKGVTVLPGMAVTVYSKTVKENLQNQPKAGKGFIVPVDAVFANDKGEKSVWVVNDGAVSRVSVTTGAYTGNSIEVMSSQIKTGTHVVTAGANFLRQGQKVRILNEAKKDDKK